jgi:hypothetical protein
MGRFDDYINSLEGRDDVDPLTIARDLHELYNEDVTTRDAKIQELSGTIAEKDSAFSVVTDELTRQKARNFDLAMQLPGTINVAGNSGEPDDEDVVLTIDDLFQKG